MGVEAHHCPFGLHALRGLRAARVAGGCPRGGGLPPLRGASSVRRCPSPCGPSSGAGGRGLATRVSRVRSVRAWKPGTGPTACALAGRRCWLWGWRRGVPGGGAFRRCEGRLRSGAPPPRVPAYSAGCWGPLPTCCRVWVWGPNTLPLACTPCGGCVPRGWWGAVPGGAWPATVVRGVWCQALSLPGSPVFWGGQPGYRNLCVPGAVGVGVGTQHRFHSMRPCGPALLAVRMAEGRPRGRCLPPL